MLTCSHSDDSSSRQASTVSVTPNGFAAPTLVNGTIYGTNVDAAQTTDGAIALFSADVQNSGTVAVTGSVVFTIVDDNGNGAGVRRGRPGREPGAAGSLTAEVVSVSVAYTVPAGGFLRVSPALPTSFGSAAERVHLWNTAYVR